MFNNFSVICSAAGKTAAGYKSTYYSGTADAYEMVYGVKGYDSGYTTTYKEAGQVSNSDFYDKSKTIKYPQRNDGLNDYWQEKHVIQRTGDRRRA